jgi:hypothetical protein
MCAETKKNNEKEVLVVTIGGKENNKSRAKISKDVMKVV